MLIRVKKLFWFLPRVFILDCTSIELFLFNCMAIDLIGIKRISIWSLYRLRIYFKLNNFCVYFKASVKKKEKIIRENVYSWNIRFSQLVKTSTFNRGSQIHSNTFFPFFLYRVHTAQTKPQKHPRWRINRSSPPPHISPLGCRRRSPPHVRRDWISWNLTTTKSPTTIIILSTKEKTLSLTTTTQTTTITLNTILYPDVSRKKVHRISKRHRNLGYRSLSCFKWIG